MLNGVALRWYDLCRTSNRPNDSTNFSSLDFVPKVSGGICRYIRGQQRAQLNHVDCVEDKKARSKIE